MKKNVIVSLADSNYFPLLEELIDSIKRFKESDTIAICVLDAGLTHDQKEVLLKKVDSVYKGLSDNIEIDGHEVEVDDQEKTQKYLLTQDEKMSESSSESYVSIIKDFLDNTIKPVDQSAAEEKQDEEYDSKKLFNTILKAENILKKTLLKPIIECIENLDRQDINVEK